MEAYKAIDMVWSKNSDKKFLTPSLLFSINFSVSTFDIPKDMIINTIYIQITHIYQEHYTRLMAKALLPDQIGVFF